jgi:hypothetical protein
MSRFEEVVNEAIEVIVLVVSERRGLRCEVESGERTGATRRGGEWLDAS